MSLINKMLQDLDARGGAGAQGGPHQAELKAVPRAERERSPALLGAAAAGIAAVAVAGWLGWRYWHNKPAAPPPAVTQVKAVPPPQAADLAAQAASPTVQAAAPAAAPAVASDTAPVSVQGVTLGASQASAPGSAPARAAAVPQPGPQAANRAPAAHAQDALAAGAVMQDRHADTGRSTARATPKHAAGRSSAGGAGDGVDGAPQTAARSKADKAGAQPALAQAGEGAAARGRRKATPAAADAADTGRQNLSPAQLSEGSYRRGLAALQEGRSSEALGHLERALEVDPRNEAARQTYISLLLEQRRPEDAIRQLRLALGIDPRQPGLAMVLARLQLERGGPALDTLMRTLPYADSSPEYQAFVAGVLQREQRHDEAAERYRAALKLSPQNGVWWMGLGISLQAGGHAPEAREAFQRARNGKGMTAELQAFVDRKLEQLSR
ncbi:tetratricopeptide repeat protein [Oxalobacteraceae bacterium A2-2]